MRKGMPATYRNSSTSHYLRVGDLARLTGKTVRAIHLYEELGLIEPATRSSGGFRLYHPTVVERVRWVKSEHGPEAMEELRALFTAKLEETRENIRRQQELESELVEGLAYLEACRVCGEPGNVDCCVSCTHDHGVEREPALVAGFKGPRDGARRVVRSGLVNVEEKS